ncbi:hypothetical protein ANN_17307 [Periplaneta americana]|uniref:Uncharacterized protein n=1 Tax=Periplaneta americana TaxID=6978 RepID=A0ABQ8SSK5_PERAM|nr:hypothetical protein ANN_17307 [Periplaneta americana]
MVTMDSTSVLAYMECHRDSVIQFSDLMKKKTVDENGITANTVFNVDESGYTTVQKRQQKVIAQKEKHQVGAPKSVNKTGTARMRLIEPFRAEEVLTVYEILEMMDEDTVGASSVIDITIFPPADGPVIDEESGDETTSDINHLPGRILRSTFEVNVTSSNDVLIDNDEVTRDYQQLTR